VARRICDGLVNDGREPKLTVSIGVAVYPKDGDTIDSLLGAADTALYAMKAKTRSPDGTGQRTAAELRHTAAAGSKATR
jgi:GGDEF domain-containing protein